MSRWHRFDNFIARLERVLITVLLSTMIATAFLQIILRNFFSTGLAWGDPLVRYLVVWIGFIGAAVATREGKHITIEIVSQWLSGRASRYVQMFSDLFSALICGLLAWAALTFVRLEAMMGGPDFFGLPGWALQVIIPIAFGLMTLRFGFQCGIGFFSPQSNKNHARD